MLSRYFLPDSQLLQSRSRRTQRELPRINDSSNVEFPAPSRTRTTDQAADSPDTRYPLFFRCTARIEIAAGVMPGRREARPRVSGFASLRRCWTSMDRPWTCANKWGQVLHTNKLSSIGRHGKTSAQGVSRRAVSNHSNFRRVTSYRPHDCNVEGWHIHWMTMCGSRIETRRWLSLTDQGAT